MRRHRRGLRARPTAPWVAALGLLLGRSAGAHTSGTAAQWGGAAPDGGIVELRLLGPGGTQVATWVQDGGTQDRLTWRPDADPRPGQVSVRWEELWVDPGPHRVEAWVPGEPAPRWVHTFVATAEPSARVAAAEHPVVGLRRHQGGHDGLSVSAATADTARIPGGTGTWDLSTVARRAATARVGPHTAPPDLREGSPSLERAEARPHALLVAVGLVPGFVLGAAAVGVAGRAAVRLRGVSRALLLALACALLVLSPVLGAPAQRLLSTGWPISDPVDSVALLATVVADLPLLDGGGAAVQWPEGTSWLASGPAALPALLLTPVCLLAGPVAAHNLGVGLGVAALALAAWALARVRGARPLPALLAGAAAVLAPAIWDEWDALSLDRATLFTVPLSLLVVDLAVRRGGMRRLLLAGVLVGTSLYWQVYHSLFFGFALPVLCAPLLVHPTGVRRLRRLLAVAGLAGLVALPGLLALTLAADAPGGDDAASVGWSTLADLPAEQGEAALLRQAQTVAAGGQDPLLMDSPEERILSAASRSWSLDAVLWPRGLLVGGPLLLWLLLASAALARHRARAVRSVWEVAVLLACSLGPVVLWRGTWTGTAGPWLLGAALVPGFEQLKNVYRFGLLAAALGGVPLALLLDGLLRRCRAPRWLQAVATLVAVGLVLGVHFRPERRGGVRVGGPVSGRALDPGPVLPPLEGPVVLVPHGSAVSAEVLLPALAAGLPVVGASPLEPGPNALTPWRDENAFLNQLAVLSADRQADRLVLGDPRVGAEDLAAAGVAAVAVRTDALAHPDLLPALEALVSPVGVVVDAVPAGWRVWRLSTPDAAP